MTFGAKIKVNIEKNGSLKLLELFHVAIYEDVVDVVLKESIIKKKYTKQIENVCWINELKFQKSLLKRMRLSAIEKKYFMQLL